MCVSIQGLHPLKDEVHGGVVFVDCEGCTE